MLAVLVNQLPARLSPSNHYVGDDCTKSKIVPMTPSFRDTLETFENSYPDRNYTIEIICPEFTSVCPKTGQPDFGMLTFEYIPDKLCVELKSLKLYLQLYRNKGIFYEKVSNMILDDFVAATQPRQAMLTAEFTPRGGISSIIKVQYAIEQA